jgi:hypothetical protein
MVAILFVLVLGMLASCSLPRRCRGPERRGCVYSVSSETSR